MSNANNLTKDVDIDIAGMLSSVWKKKWWLLALTLLSGVLFFLAFSTISPRYESASKILIEKRESVFTQVGQDNFSGTSKFDAETIGSQVQILNSTDLILAVIKDANLINEPEFAPKSSGFGELLGIFGSSANKPQMTQEEKVLKEFSKRLSAYSISGSRVLSIEFWANDRAVAKRVVNLMADKFIQFSKTAENSSTEDATKWLEPQIKDLRASLLDAETKVAEFRSASDILVGQNNSLLATQQLSEFSTELSRVRAAKSSAMGKVESIKRTLEQGGSLDVVPEVIASPLIQRLRERQVTLKGEISELSTTLLPNHPRIKALRSQLSGLDSQIRSAARDIMKSLENNADQAVRQEAVLLQEVNRLKAESSRVSEAEVQLRALEREAASQRELLQSYLSRFREAASRQNADYNPVDARIISKGTEAAESHFPKVLPFTIAGMTSVLLLSIVALLTGQLLSGKAFKREDEYAAADPQTAYSNEAIAVSNAPKLVPARADLMIDDDITLTAPTAMAANDSELFSADLAYQAIGQLGKAKIAFVSPGGDAGSLRTAQCVRTLAKAGKSCVAIDLTGNGITASVMLGGNNVKGLRDVVGGTSTLRDALYKDRLTDAHVLASGNISNDELKQNIDRLGQVSLALQQSYDFVVFDCGYIGADGLVKIADRETVVVISSDGVSANESVALERQLKQSGFVETIVLRAGDTAQSSAA